MTKTSFRKIGVLTSGGDCAGLNAVIRAVTDAATGRGWEVLGLRNGHHGLLESPPAVMPLTADNVRGDLLRAGGTVLGTTTKGDPFAYPAPGGADAILMPEAPYDLDNMATHVRRITHDRPSPVLVVVAEGVAQPAEERRKKANVGLAIARGLQSRTGFDARCTVLGHVQRGGSPVAFDRILGSTFGARAVSVLANGGTKRMVAWRGGLVTDIPMTDVVLGPRFVSADSQIVRTARRLGIYLGEGLEAR